MARLALYLLGPPRLERDGAPVKVNRRKVIALLAYLAVAGQGPVGRPHAREALATLLSPEFDTSRARNELRRTLSVLNRLLGPDCLIVDRETVSLDPTAALWLDVDRFCRSLAACDAHDHPPNTPCPDCVPLLEGAVALYQDHFLAGFTLPASLAFEEWAFFQSEQLRNRLAGALERLVAWHSGQHAYEPTILFAQRWLALDPLHEPAQRQLMALYARAGRRAAALRQYRACLRALEEELGLPPSAETTALYQRIRADREVEVAAPTPPPRPSATPAPPAFLTEEAEAATAERPVFVARERELAQLSRHLEAALAGQGKVVLVTGGPGRGKTALMREFARRAMDRHPDLVVATGNCRAYTGIGDPYLPFREVLSMLTGDVESRWAAGAITRGHAQRLWAALPQAVQALLDHGSALIDIFLPGAALLSRAAAAARDGAGWLEHLQETLEREKLKPGGGSTKLAKVLAQSQLFEGYTGTLRALAARRPLLLALDDLQWVDAASASLLFHLGLQL
jgi:DNA-binding SARP family transcriptional activator